MLVAGACGGASAGDADRPGGDLAGQTLTVAAVWTGAEQQNFRTVLDAFAKRTGATVKFTPTGDNVSTYLDSKIQGGDPPDVAMLPQQGALVQFAKAGHLKPANQRVQRAVGANFATIWRTLGSVDSTLYGVYFKAANKSTVWYRTQAFEDAGVRPPKTWDEFVTVAKAVSESGTPALAVGGADGWTLTDWFENVYLSQAGPDLYDKLSRHEIPWTHPSVTAALTTLGQLWTSPGVVAGGPAQALQTDFPTSVSDTFAAKPKAAMVYEGDFVAGVIGDLKTARVGEDAKLFPFPAVGESTPVVSGGDAAVAMTDRKGAQELLEFLASPEAARVWASAGGFTSPNRNLDVAAYPDETSRVIAKNLVAAGDRVRFDMSDLAPAAFGGTKGVGEWKHLQDFLARPADVAGVAHRLEADAAKAFQG
jgi:multiple sugar transport system substrate-binding protein/alpha-glucoside transport system substrate-binding protein